MRPQRDAATSLVAGAGPGGLHGPRLASAGPGRVTARARQISRFAGPVLESSENRARAGALPTRLCRPAQMQSGPGFYMPAGERNAPAGRGGVRNLEDGLSVRSRPGSGRCRRPGQGKLGVRAAEQ